MRLLICGDRDWHDGEMIERMLRHLAEPPEVVIQGAARGADSLAWQAAESLRIPVLTFPAKWQLYGRAAGPVRNRQMISEGKPTHVWAFHDDIEISRGRCSAQHHSKPESILKTSHSTSSGRTET